MTSFDPIAVGDKIRVHLDKADKAKADQLRHATAAGVLLLDVKESHPEHIGDMCERLGLGHSRLGELLMIASGKRTQEENRAKTKARVDKYRKKKKAKALPPPEPEVCPLQAPVTDEPAHGTESVLPAPEPEPRPLQGRVTDDDEKTSEEWANEITKLVAAGDEEAVGVFVSAIDILIELNSRRSSGPDFWRFRQALSGDALRMAIDFLCDVENAEDNEEIAA
jgi:hypothetical protein